MAFFGLILSMSRFKNWSREELWSDIKHPMSNSPNFSRFMKRYRFNDLVKAIGFVPLVDDFEDVQERSSSPISCDDQSTS
jgi:hypothetical protein